MHKYQITAVGIAGLLTVLAVGCSKMTADEAGNVRKSFGLPADMPLKDLGVVELRIGIPKRVKVGWGKDCTLTAVTLTNGLVELNLLYESRSEIINGVKVQPYSERSQTVLSQRLLASAVQSKSWLCFPPMRSRFVVTLQPRIIP